MSYFAYVCKITDMRKDENSERLYLGRCFGEGVIVGPDIHSDDLVLYLPSDGKIERWFGNTFNLFRKNEDGSLQGGYVENNGHIRAVKLRGNQSSGIVIALDRVYEAFGNQGWHEGDNVIEINGKQFCEKYIPVHKAAYHGTQKAKTSYKGKKSGEIQYPNFEMHADTEQLAYNLNQFYPGDRINLSLKMHGTSSRHAYTEAVLPNNWFRRLLHLKPKTRMEYVLGTRRTVCSNSSSGFYGTDEFRRKVHEMIKPHLEPNMEVFGEIVGYYGPNESDTIMPSADNKKINDKAFVKEFGPITTFSYGCNPGECEFYVYRITKDNGAIEFTPDEITKWCDEHGLKHVPYIDEFEFTTAEDLMERIDNYFQDLHDPIGKTHIKEGVVVRILNRQRWVAYKSKTWEFKVLENLIKDTSDIPDMEEIQEVDGDNYDEES